MKEIMIYDDERINLKNSLTRIGDLINLDGPLLSLFIDERTNDFYIFDWVDQLNNKVNRWLVYKISARILNRFIRKEISYKYLFELSLIDTKNCYYADIENSKEYAYVLTELDHVPEDYFPTEEVFFEENDAKNFTLINEVVSRMIAIEINLVTGTKNLFPLEKEYPVIKGWSLSYTRQAIIDMAVFQIEKNDNALPKNFPSKIEAQQHVRENNRLSQRERMDFHLR